MNNVERLDKVKDAMNAYRLANNLESYESIDRMKFIAWLWDRRE